jgi:hypothetical protein
VSEPQHDAPPVGEEIHLPPPTVVPALTALGITLTLIGLTTFIELTVIGGLLTLGCVWSWIKTARAETDELPLD